MLNRRSLTLAALALPVSSVIQFQARAQAARPLVVFLGNDQCGFCKMWRAQAEPAFTSSEVFKKLDYRVVHPATFDAMLQEESWPADLRWLLTEFEMSDESAQRGLWTPRFFLARDKKIIFTTTGNDGWKLKMWPRIVEATGTRG
jgi:hypothetical protein